MSGSPNPENVLPIAGTAPAKSVQPPELNTVLPKLDKFLKAASAQYEACISHIEHEYVLDGASATLRLHYVRIDQNGRPKFKELAQVLAMHLGQYAIMAQRHATAKTHVDHAKIHLEAKKLLRRYAKTGEPGELLLYFLIESVLKAPQAICKMSLKTNRKEEVKGSDGVHLRWDSSRNKLVLYFGEAKLWESVTSAMTGALKSIESFHSEGAEEHEVFLVSNHFNLLDPKLRERVAAFLDRTSSKESYELQHVCLIGYDWKQYGDLSIAKKRKEFIDNFEARYLEHADEIRTGLNERFKKFKYNHLTFEFFFIPFESVQEFRSWFLDEVFGEVSK